MSGELEQVTSRIEAVQSGAETADEQQRAGMEKRVQVPNRPLAALSLGPALSSPLAAFPSPSVQPRAPKPHLSPT